MTELLPSNGHVVLHRIEPEEKTAGGIHLPEGNHTAAELFAKNVVVAVAPDVTRCAVGDRVVIDVQFGMVPVNVEGLPRGRTHNVDGERKTLPAWFIVPENAIRAVVKEK